MIPLINDLGKLKWDFVAYTRDWHPQNHVSFASNHDSQKPFNVIAVERRGRSKDQVLWPDHCVQNTNGATLAPELDVPQGAVEILKGTQPDAEFYSAFADVWGDNPTELALLLREKGITDVYVVGLAKDYCVLNTAVDSAMHGWNTFVIDEATRPVSVDDEPATEAKLKDSGVRLISIDSEHIRKLRDNLR